MKRYIAWTFYLTLFICLLISRKGASREKKEANCIRVKDATGRIVEVRQPVKRLAVLTSDALEIIRAVKAGDLVVGVYSDISKDPLFWTGLTHKPKIGSWKELNYELVAELDPDIVICYAQRPGRDMEKRIDPFGIKTIRLDFFKLNNLEKEVEALGRILKKEKEASQLIAWYRKNLDFIREKLKVTNKSPSVYIEGDSNYHTTGLGSGGHDMCVFAGGANIAADLSIPYPEVTPEWILMKNPCVILKITTLSTCNACYSMINAAPLKAIRNKIMARPAWDNISAVKEGKVYVMANEIWTGPRAIIGISYIAKWLHPDIFEELDPRGLHKEYIKKFQGIEYKGFYVYPGSN